MHWCNVDGLREHLGAVGKKPSRKTIYNLVTAGMKVARLGESGRRLMFSIKWCDDS